MFVCMCACVHAFMFVCVCACLARARSLSLSMFISMRHLTYNLQTVTPRAVMAMVVWMATKRRSVLHDELLSYRIIHCRRATCDEPTGSNLEKKKQLRRRKVRSAWRWKRQTWDESGSCVDVHTIFWHVAHDSTFTLNLINRLVSIEACSLIIRKADTSSVFLLLHISSELALPMDNNCFAIAIAYNFGRRPGHTSIVARPHDQHNWLDLPLRCLFWKEWTTHGDGMLTHAAGGFGIGCGVLHHLI